MAVSESSVEELIAFTAEAPLVEVAHDPQLLRGWVGYQDPTIGFWWLKATAPPGSCLVFYGQDPPTSDEQGTPSAYPQEVVVEAPPSPRVPPTNLTPWNEINEEILPQYRQSSAAASASDYVPPPPAPWIEYEERPRCGYHNTRRHPEQMTWWQGKYWCGHDGHAQCDPTPTTRCSVHGYLRQMRHLRWTGSCHQFPVKRLVCIPTANCMWNLREW